MFSVYFKCLIIILDRGIILELKLVNPSIKSYQFIAFPLAIIEQYDESKKWLFNNFIQLAYDNQKNSPVPFCFYMLDYTINPFLDVMRFSREIKNLVNLNIIEFTQKAIENNYYLYLNVDEYYIPNRKSYTKQHYSHDILAYGFDKNKKVFKVLGYDNTMKFAPSEVPYEKFANAYTSLDKINNDCEQICLFKPKIEPYEVSGSIIKDRLIDYIESKNTSLQYADLREPWERSYGLSAYTSLKAYFESFKRNSFEKIDPINSLIILEHKRLMRDRVNFLSSNGFLKERIDLASFEELEKLSETIHLLCLKFNIKRDISIIDNLINIMNILKDKEEQTYSKLIELL